MREKEFWQVYSEYLDLSISMTGKIVAHKAKNPDADVTEQLKVVAKVDWMGQMIHKLYHMVLLANIAHGDFIAERGRIMNAAGKENYHLKRRVEELEKENAILKEQILNKND